MEKLTVLGGSSPATLYFIDALSEKLHLLPKYELMLYGRDEKALQFV